MAIQYKALAFALLFAPAVVVAGNSEFGELTPELFSLETVTDEMKTTEMMSMDEINKELEEQPTAAGGKMEDVLQDPYGNQVHSNW
ncbi:hypothetical protein [Neptuniibacter sp.]|uniref:hypothetical protein n=1 Tax=Neptuniibacter sp. TaxID=1962643 RepID=UPI00261CAF20|nr:hypothetical protein [Neptuniibacter sp.]MCP4596458.1 hypothetical protein [Neptuniibacter sp.]